MFSLHNQLGPTGLCTIHSFDGIWEQTFIQGKWEASNIDNSHNSW